MATVNTTFTFSSTDISSDALSFSVSETLALTGSGGIQRANLTSATGSASAFELYNSESFGDNLESGVTSPTYLYLKNITGSGFSASAAAQPTASVLHIFITSSGQINDFTGGATVESPGCYDIARIPQGSFMYLPINPRVSYVCYTPTGSECNENMNTLIEYGIFR